MNSILIKDTTREERELIVAESIGNISGACDGCAAGLADIYYEYIDGKKEIRFSGLVDAVNARKAELAATGKTSIGIFCRSTKDCVVTVFAAVAAKMQVVMLDDSLADSVIARQINFISLRYSSSKSFRQPKGI